jgi:hypothetical protein
MKYIEKLAGFPFFLKFMHSWDELKGQNSCFTPECVRMLPTEVLLRYPIKLEGITAIILLTKAILLFTYFGRFIEMNSHI